MPFWTRLISTCFSCSGSPSTGGSVAARSTERVSAGGSSFWIRRMVRATTSLMSTVPKLCFSGRA